MYKMELDWLMSCYRGRLSVCHCKEDFYIHIYILHKMELKFTDALVNSIGAPTV
jgi:hypothetical protein